jgi:hypothetical protein
MGVSTLAATASAPLTGVRGGLDATRLLRAFLSLALAAGVLARALVLDVRGVGGVELYRGSLAGLSRVGLGTLPAGAARTYRVTVALAAGAGNEVAGSSLGARLVWSAA